LNGDTIVIGRVVLPGIGSYEGVSTIIAQFVFLIPFIIGRWVLRSGADNEEILRVLVIAGLIYSLPMLFEIRFSPQLHTWIYGYFPGMFGQQMRDEGFRPIVFLGHGLTLAVFTMTSLLAAAAFWRSNTRVVRVPPAGVAAYLGVLLVLCKTFAAFVYGMVLVPLVRWAKPKTQLRVAALLVTIALAYPMLRAMDLVPTTFMLEAANLVSADRAGSLETRFVNEHRLLERASQRIWFGWGRFARSRVYDADGKDISLTDGNWIIIMGEFGIVGFLARFGIFALTVFRAAKALKFEEAAKYRIYFSALALIVASQVINLLPNSSNPPWFWLLVGALLGRAELLGASGAKNSSVFRQNLRRQSSGAPTICSTLKPGT
jgi:hypothetical protein